MKEFEINSYGQSQGYEVKVILGGEKYIEIAQKNHITYHFIPLLRDKEWCPLISLANIIVCFGNIFTLSSIDSKV